ncbi:hypothetical protein DFA_11668 [Cavenderia fasciculata]|uniref:Thioredoxin domain-containing protein n=1 Tax=Cavenderia fasciculata TaxID=261658 RepID=F4QDW0_CACFS|nr:uncharacterized protein DFA_11668 [Cavenderia fasciculata]EGG13907.1 hypothetical protein DFA_11668 [Cavenderia fasciculata]|eukprot:XP_004350615.1 hypothetical protein DFA_11668 [Cavenderia fasciculata]
MVTQTPTGFIVLPNVAAVEDVLFNSPSDQTIVFYFTEPICPGCDTIHNRLCQWTTLFPTVKFYQIKTEIPGITTHQSTDIYYPLPCIKTFKDYPSFYNRITKRNGVNTGLYESDINYALSL